MVYGYDTNEEFIDKSYQLLEKFEAKGLWNKDTLVIGLDKSVRPLTYTLRKLSSEEGGETPDIRFFNYSSLDYGVRAKSKKRIAEYMGQKTNPEKFSNYKNILILDEHTFGGDSLKDMGKILTQYFSNLKSKPNISFAFLGKTESTPLGISGKKTTFLRGERPWEKARSFDTGIREKYRFLDEPKIQESRALWNNKRMKKELKQDLPEDIKSKIRTEMRENKQNYKKFLSNRRQLSSDIKNYLHEKHPEKVLGKNNSGTLEKIVSGVFVLSFLVGLFLSSGNLTGNAIGSSGSFHKLIGIILILVGIGGFFVYRKLIN